MNDLFIAAKPALLAMEESTLQRSRVSRERATSLTASLVAALTPIEAQFAVELSPERAAERSADLLAVMPNAQIFYAADLAVEDPWTPVGKARFADLAKKVRAHDRTLSTWGVPLFKDDKDLGPVVADIMRGRGKRDDADDTIRWVAMFRNQWSWAAGKTPIKAAYLDVAEAEATELLHLLDAGQKDERPGSPRDLRTRAYTRWILTYNELLAAGRYVLRHDPEALERLVSVFPERLAAPSQPPAAPAQGDEGAKAETAKGDEAAKPAKVEAAKGDEAAKPPDPAKPAAPKPA